MIGVYRLEDGGPQGSCLSPLLFNIFVRNLPRATQSRTIQFADDVTQSEADKDESKVVCRLTDTFHRTKEFCIQRELIINTGKTQFIIFKSPRRKLSSELEIVLDGVSIQPSHHVKLLGMILDRHLTFGDHIDNTVKKCNGVIGMLSRAASHLPRELLRAAYIALGRTHLEYACAAFASASKSQLKKLDVVQKIASRVICRAPRDAHSAPLLEMLHLESLDTRRRAHIGKIVDAALSGNSHPSLTGMFTKDSNGLTTNDHTARIGIGKRRFSIFAKDISNSIHSQQGSALALTRFCSRTDINRESTAC